MDTGKAVNPRIRRATSRIVSHIAAEEPEIREMLQAASQALSPAITIRSRRARPSLDVHALAIWAENLDLPSRVGVPREQALYEQDLSQVARSPDPPPRPHRSEI